VPCSKAGLPSSRLEIEITESVLLQESEVNLAILHRLSDLGIAIALDDFGTGYSSLSYLRKFPFTRIKIDRSFVGNIEEEGESQAIIRAITSLGHSLGMAITAEGVETQQQLTHVRSNGCNEVQGYFFSPPVDAEAIQAIITEIGTIDGSTEGVVAPALPQPYRPEFRWPQLKHASRKLSRMFH
jgi:EAL domain-containing protein (putative c-di-GMP-specific phosphodiesterase class I)